MNLINRLIQTKKRIEKYIEENGLDATVKNFGVNILVRYKFLAKFKGTKLYYNIIGAIDKVYNKKGEYLGGITHLMSTHYKELGHFFGPCLNGNIILSHRNRDGLVKSYAIFDKNGDCIVGYNIYFNFQYLPNGVALMGNSEKPLTNALTIHYDGTIKKQPFSFINEKNGKYKCRNIDSGISISYWKDESEIEEMIEDSNDIEKGSN